MRKIIMVVAAVAAMSLAGAGSALADETAPHQEYQCSPGILGTGLLCNSAPAPGPPPEDDVFQGGPLGADSALATTIGGLLG